MDYSTKRWYVCQTYSGYEKSVKQDIERRIESLGMQDLVFQVLVFEKTEEIKTVDKNGNEKIKEKVTNLFPGYVFVEMIVTDDSWFMVRNTPKVTGFVGSSGNGAKPVPIPQDEMNQILKSQGMVQSNVNFKKGDNVRITHGSFMGQVTAVDSIDVEKSEVTVLVDILGQTAPMTLPISDVELV